MRFIIGDVHGEFSKLENLYKEILKKDKKPVLYFCGDFCDRGPDTKKVVDFIIDNKFLAARGNHDDIFDSILNGFSPYARYQNSTEHESLINLEWFLSFGMKETLASYLTEEFTRDDLDYLITEIRAGRFSNAKYKLESFRDIVPQSHKDFFHNLPLIIEDEDFFVAHAYIDPEVEDYYNLSTSVDNVLWGHFSRNEIHQPKSWGKKGYFGHYWTKNYGEPADKPIIGDDIVLMDTGCGLNKSGVLSAFCHD